VKEYSRGVVVVVVVVVVVLEMERKQAKSRLEAVLLVCR